MLQRTLNKRYKLLRKIGTGGMADVYLAEDLLLDRQVAIKIMHPQLAADPTFVERFKREARAVANLQHQNIVNVFDWGADEEIYYLVMEYLKGQNLKDFLNSRAPLTPDTVVDIASKICDALTEAHDHEIVHRDIKPQNIILTENGELKVTDFGIARAVSATMTRTGSILGTAHYISPEQALGRKVDVTSDIYSLGVLMYEMLTGDLPFRGDNPINIAMKHINEDPLPPSRLRDDIPPGLERVIMKALNKDPAYRYPSAAEMKEALRRSLTMEIPPGTETMVIPTYRQDQEETAAIPTSARPATIPSWLGWSLLFVALLALAGLGIWTALALTRVEYVDVPTVTGLSVPEAQQKLERVGLDLKIVDQKPNHTVPAGHIIDQDPLAGARARKGDAVNVTISLGVETTKIPTLIGLTIDEAKEELRKAELQLGSVSHAPSSSVAAGKIMRQSVDPGITVSKRSPIDVVVSQGVPKIIVPNLVGLKFEDAVAILKQYGLKYGREDRVDDGAPAGEIISQSSDPGTEVEKGTIVTLVVSLGPESVQVPNEVGREATTAEKELQRRGLKANFISDPSLPDQKDRVIRQDPEPGTTVAKGSTVTLYIGDGTIQEQPPPEETQPPPEETQPPGQTEPPSEEPQPAP
ncbi:eukaryotic-like serine/threonine-protein kinase [Candidatus Hakubella thermalkaliphila]|uniref:non-specific serine/threonine protein kinase n=2 Tax=Candidatus Hakubella thermalkaliphila TaxID=2754717 RepID=A0A6V8PRH2_9ACTN|nr:PASTA domain-containing protein [Candidatus Hakubella thermalkaliphila]GFP26790.1 eukaryotic-like serine/threonine-protein kinase [Candidatus Hakubella thermalkaliphila]GFP34384.1 eukaryotic-like serine/threonine-protein kinase [Candidatus Hakubella thermalkaliphila]